MALSRFGFVPDGVTLVAPHEIPLRNSVGRGRGFLR